MTYLLVGNQQASATLPYVLNISQTSCILTTIHITRPYLIRTKPPTLSTQGVALPSLALGTMAHTCGAIVVIGRLGPIQPTLPTQQQQSTNLDAPCTLTVVSPSIAT